MSKPKFTPGPWKWQDDDCSRLMLISTNPEPNEHSPTGISLPTVLLPGLAICGYCDADAHVEISDADANLIAAAPDLYYALDKLFEVVTGDIPVGLSQVVYEALAKARGES